MGNTNTKEISPNDASQQGTIKEKSRSSEKFSKRLSKFFKENSKDATALHSSPAPPSDTTASTDNPPAKNKCDPKPLTDHLTEEQRRKLTDKELQALLSNEIPASEIEQLSIGVDSGGMGVIHMAVWKGEKVAIKEATTAVVAREVDVYMRMRGCENVVPFYGVTCPPGLDKICIVTKFASGGSLTWYIKVYFNKMTWDDKLRLAYQVTAGIARLHQEGVYHRDLHGGNVLIDESGNALLTDFGASSVIMEQRITRNIEDYRIQATDNPDGTSKYTSKVIEPQSGDKKGTHPLVGVMAYIAPELFRDPSTFNAKCDVYSLGVLFWELTSGRSAFSRRPQDVELAISILNGLREMPNAGTPPAFQRLYERCWSPNPAERPEVKEILNELEKIRASMTKEELAVTLTRDDTGIANPFECTESVSVQRPTSAIQSNFLLDD
ncbi:hypothetical protein BGW41_004127 [Actinomortierella wolfii]|nr:hypothetical protein BGW41_004127 [Actinomortierella wolfii]